MSMLTNPVFDEKRAGSMLSLAIGDAWGDPMEFRRYADIERAHGRWGPDFPLRRARITDDTQMSFAVWDAIAEVASPEGNWSVDALGEAFGKHYATWSVDVDNNRAPGGATMSACRRLVAGDPWYTSGGLTAGGCGAVMRAPWIGVHPHLSENTFAVALAARVSSVVTHADPGAVAAAETTAVLTRHLMTGNVRPEQAIDWMEQYAEHGPGRWATAPSLVDEQHHLDAWTKIKGAAFDAREISTRLRADYWGPDPSDPSSWRDKELGDGGWGAVSALGIAVGILAAGFPDNALRRAAKTDGDSDSIGAVTGGLLGAAYGVLPQVAELAEYLEPRYVAALHDRVLYRLGNPLPPPVFPTELGSRRPLVRDSERGEAADLSGA